MLKRRETYFFVQNRACWVNQMLYTHPVLLEEVDPFPPQPDGNFLLALSIDKVLVVVDVLPLGTNALSLQEIGFIRHSWSTNAR